MVQKRATIPLLEGPCIWFEAYDIQRCRNVYIKDTWWVDLPGIQREGKSYELLHAAGVRNLAVCSAAGDIDRKSTRLNSSHRR